MLDMEDDKGGLIGGGEGSLHPRHNQTHLFQRGVREAWINIDHRMVLAVL